MTDTPRDDTRASADTPGRGKDERPAPEIRNDFAAAGLTLAILALLCDFFAVRVGIGLAAAGIVLALAGLRRAVRTDVGLTRTVTALCLGLLALAIGTIVLGGQRGGQYTGQAPTPQRLSAGTNSRSVAPV